MCVMMVAAVSGAVSRNPKTPSQDEPRNSTNNNPRRPPLLPDNNGTANPKRPKSRTVQSRYMSPSPSTSSSNSSSLSSTSTSSSARRFPSPLVSRNSGNTPASVPKRSVSVDRRRPSTVSRPLTPDLDSKLSNVPEVSAATKLLVTSTRSLSVSFQGETFSLPVSKTKAAPPSPNLRKGTPERRRTTTPLRGKVDGAADQLENSKHIDQHRWPGRSRQGGNFLARSLDCSNGDRNKVIGSGNVIRTLQQSMMDERRASFEGRLSLDLGNAEPLKAVEQHTRDVVNSLNNESSLPSDLTASDTDSVSSGSTSGMQESGGSTRIRSVPRGIVVSARFWQETNSRLRRLQDPGSPLSTSPGTKLVGTPKLRKYPSDVPVSSPRAMSSPVRGGIRCASPSKLIGSSPSRGMPSPSRVRNAVSTINSNFVETPSVLSFAVDVRRGKVGENRIVDAHLLRLLYNRHLQWRFVNATTEATLLVQKHNAEKTLWNAWITISDLRDTVTKKRHRLQLLRQKLKLASILRGQMMSLENWASFDKEHSISLLGAIEALKASTLRLPVGEGAHADVQNLKDAISSAHGVMQAMASSVGSILGKVEELNSLVTELAKIAGKEQASLEHCKDFLSMIATMQVKDCSLRTHVLQHNRVSTA